MSTASQVHGRSTWNKRDYQNCIERAPKEVRERLSDRPGEFRCFVSAMANRQWAQAHPPLCLQSIAAIPENLRSRRHELIEKIARQGIGELCPEEVSAHFMQAYQDGDWPLAIQLTKHFGPLAASSTGDTLLHLIAWAKAPEKWLLKALEAQASGVDLKNIYGSPPLHLAALRGNEGVINHLVAAGVDGSLICSKSYSALSLAQTYYTRLSSYSLDKLLQADGGITQELQDRKLLAGAFGIAGASALNSQPIGSGCESTSAQSCLLTSAFSYYAELEQSPSAWEELLASASHATRDAAKRVGITALNEILNESLEAIRDSAPSTVETTLNRLDQGKIAAFLTGWNGHATALVFDQILGFMASCNKGEGSGHYAGVTFFPLKSQNRRTWERALNNCIWTREGKFPLGDKTKKYLKNGILKDLCFLGGKTGKQWQHGHLIPQEEQKVGNCALASANSMELALLTLLLRRKMGQKQAEELAQRIKKRRTHHSRILALKTYLERHAKPQPYPPDEALLRSIQQKKTRYPELDTQIGSLLQTFFSRTSSNPPAPQKSRLPT